MKIECIKDSLVLAVGKAEKIAGRNPTLPALSGIYLEAAKNNLVVKSTNLDLGLSITLPVKVFEPGKVLVPASVINSFLNSLNKEQKITLETKEKVLNIDTKLTKTNIKTLPSEDFPVIPEIADDLAFSLPAKDLILGLRSVIYAAAVGSVKPELSSVSMAYANGELVFAATDSFRLAEKKIKTKKIPHFERILIPQKNVLEIIRVFDDLGEEISLSIGEHQVALRSGNVYLTSRTIEGVFPDYKQIIPKSSSAKAVVLKQDLLNSLKTSLVFADNFHQLTLTLLPKEKKFKIESKNNTVGENTYLLDAVVEGESLSISVNHHYFSDCLQATREDSLSLSFAGAAKPILIEAVGDPSFLYLVMPMNRS